jgi:hypothetical protein
MATAAIATTGERRTTRLRFVATIFTGSFLLFLVQPMIARMALPRLGGAPAVWNSAMVVYQALLLGGYAYAHWLGRFSPRVQARVHLSLFAVAGLMLPIGLTGAIPPVDANPFLWVPWLFLVSIGPLFLVVAASTYHWSVNIGSMTTFERSPNGCMIFFSSTLIIRPSESMSAKWSRL